MGTTVTDFSPPGGCGIKAAATSLLKSVALYACPGIRQRWLADFRGPSRHRDASLKPRHDVTDHARGSAASLLCFVLRDCFSVAWG